MPLTRDRVDGAAYRRHLRQRRGDRAGLRQPEIGGIDAGDRFAEGHRVSDAAGVGQAADGAVRLMDTTWENVWALG